MTRPTRHRAVAALAVVLALTGPLWLPRPALWAGASTGVVLLVTALFVNRRFLAARSHLDAKQYDAAIAEAAGYEADLLRDEWRRLLAVMTVGLFTSDGVAAARNLIGAAHFDAKRFDEAERAFRQAIERDPLYAVPWGNLAMVCAARGDDEGERVHGERALALGFDRKALERALAVVKAER